jgi:hypothetical protein
MTNLKYDKYIKSEFWQTKRIKALKRAGNKCQVCNGSNKLEVHHRTYERLGNENKKDLTVLCFDCHEKFHSEKTQILKKEIKQIDDDILFSETSLKRYVYLDANPKIIQGAKNYITELKEKSIILNLKLKELECREIE